MTGSVSWSNNKFADMICIPVLEVAGSITSAPPACTIPTPPSMPNAFGMEGPVISASRIAVWKPRLFILTANREVTKDFPTPPLPLTTPMTFLTELSGFNFSRKLFLSCVLLLQFSPQVLQLCVQFSLMVFLQLKS